MVNRYRADDVFTSQVPMCCVQGVRKHFQTDESLILPETRAIIQPRGFDKDEYNIGFM